MPSAIEHARHSLRTLGIDALDVHSWIDKPFLILHSRKHRIFRHDLGKALQELTETRKDLIRKYGIETLTNVVRDHIEFDSEERNIIINLYRRTPKDLGL